MSHNILYRIFKHVKINSGSKGKLKLLILFAASVAGGLIDVISVAGFIPLVLLIADPDIITNSVILAGIYNYFEFTSRDGFILFFLASIFVVFLVKNIFLILLHYYQGVFAYNTSTRISRKMINNYFSRGFLFFKNTESFHISHNTLVIPHNFSHGMILPFFNLFSEMMVVVFIITAIAVYNASILFTLFIIMVPVGLVLFFIVKGRMVNLGNKKNYWNEKAFSILLQSIAGMGDIKLMHKENYFADEFISRENMLHRVMAKIYGYNNSTRFIIESGALMAILFIAIFAFSFAGGASDLFLFLTMLAAAAYRLLPSVNRVVSYMMSIKSFQYTLDVIENAETEKHDLPYEFSNGDIKLGELQSGINFREVSYKYSPAGDLVLDGLSATIEKGKITGISGRSGSGKSTFIYLLTAFIEPVKGTVLVDDIALDKLDIASWQKKIALVKQDAYLLNSTLEENITLSAKGTADRKKLADVIKLSALQDVISRLPNGLSSETGETGNFLSSGQKQRLAIARALYRDAEILIFDEATNAIDVETENEIILAIQRLQQLGKTIIIISHRLNTMKVCDKILLLQQGKIAGEITYPQLEIMHGNQPVEADQ